MSQPATKPPTLADIAAQITAGRVEYVYATCGWRRCGRAHVPIDISVLISRLGPDHKFKTVRLRCLKCAAEGRDPSVVEINVDWAHMAHVTGYHPGHHTPNADQTTSCPVTIIKKRRRKTTTYRPKPI